MVDCKRADGAQLFGCRGAIGLNVATSLVSTSTSTNIQHLAQKSTFTMVCWVKLNVMLGKSKCISTCTMKDDWRMWVDQIAAAPVLPSTHQLDQSNPICWWFMFQNFVSGASAEPWGSSLKMTAVMPDVCNQYATPDCFLFVLAIAPVRSSM